MRFYKPKTNVPYKWHVKLRNTSSAILLFGTCCCCCVNGKIYYVGLKPEWNTTCLHVLFSTLLNPPLFWMSAARPCWTVPKPFWTSVARLLEMLSPDECFKQDTRLRASTYVPSDASTDVAIYFSFSRCFTSLAQLAFQKWCSKELACCCWSVIAEKLFIIFRGPCA